MANPDQAKVEFIKQNYPNFEKLNAYDFTTLSNIAHKMKMLGFYKRHASTPMIEESVRKVILEAQGKNKKSIRSRINNQDYCG